MVDAEITKRGRELADKLSNIIGGTTTDILRICSLIARHAQTYGHIQERWANVEMSDRVTAQWERKEANLERRITELVEMLPETDEGPLRVHFDGEPRGNTVKLVRPWDPDDSYGIGADV